MAVSVKLGYRVNSLDCENDEPPIAVQCSGAIEAMAFLFAITLTPPGTTFEGSLLDLMDM